MECDKVLGSLRAYEVWNRVLVKKLPSQVFEVNLEDGELGLFALVVLANLGYEKKLVRLFFE